MPILLQYINTATPNTCGSANLNWADFKPLAKSENDGRVYILVGNAPGRGTSPTHEIKDALKSAGFRWAPGDWPCWHLSVAAADEDPKEIVTKASWAHRASGVEVRLMNSQDEMIDRCFVDGGAAIWEG